MMSFSGYIHEQMSAAHHRDLLEAAEHARLIAQARRQDRVRHRSFLRRRASQPRMTIAPHQRTGPDVRAPTSPSASR